MITSLEMGVAIYRERATAIMRALNAGKIPRDATSGLAMMVAAVSVIRLDCPHATLDEVIAAVRVMWSISPPGEPAPPKDPS